MHNGDKIIEQNNHYKNNFDYELKRSVVPKNSGNSKTSNEDTIALVIIIVLTVFVIILTVFIFILYKCKKRRTKLYQYQKINSKPKSKLRVNVQNQRLLSNVLEISNVNFNSSDSLNETPMKDEFVIPPITPATPDGGIAPFPTHFSKHAFHYELKRSISLPNNKSCKDKEDENLWKASVKKASQNQLLQTKPKLDRRISNCENGKIRFSLRYNEDGNKDLNVKVLGFVDLPLSKETGISIPFVKVYLYPQVAHTYHEAKNGFRLQILNFPIDTHCSFHNNDIRQLCSSALKFVILDYDRFSRSEFVADCVVLLDEISLEGEAISKHLSIRKIQPEIDIGSLLISLCLQPNACRMSINVLKANALPLADHGNYPDYFVKITLMCKDTILDKRRTHVIKKSASPVFNENLAFPVDVRNIRNLVLIFDVIRHDSKLKQEKIGSVILANHSIQRQVTPHEIQHFNEMLTSPQRQISEWHKLVP